MDVMIPALRIVQLPFRRNRSLDLIVIIAMTSICDAVVDSPVGNVHGKEDLDL